MGSGLMLFGGGSPGPLPGVFVPNTRNPPQPGPPVASEESSRDGAPGVSVAVLRELQALQGIGDQILDALVPRARLLQLAAGQHLLRRGEPNLRVYILLSGLLRVELDDSPLAYIEQGETVGGLSLRPGSSPTPTVAP